MGLGRLDSTGGGDVQLSCQKEMIIYVNNRKKTRHHLRQNKGGEGHRDYLRERMQFSSVSHGDKGGESLERWGMKAGERAKE